MNCFIFWVNCSCQIRAQKFYFVCALIFEFHIFKWKIPTNKTTEHNIQKVNFFNRNLSNVSETSNNIHLYYATCWCCEQCFVGNFLASAKNIQMGGLNGEVEKEMNHKNLKGASPFWPFRSPLAASFIPKVLSLWILSIAVRCSVCLPNAINIPVHVNIIAVSFCCCQQTCYQTAAADSAALGLSLSLCRFIALLISRKAYYTVHSVGHCVH